LKESVIHHLFNGICREKRLALGGAALGVVLTVPSVTNCDISPSLIADNFSKHFIVENSWWHEPQAKNIAHSPSCIKNLANGNQTKANTHLQCWVVRCLCHIICLKLGHHVDRTALASFQSNTLTETEPRRYNAFPAIKRKKDILAGKRDHLRGLNEEHKVVTPHRVKGSGGAK